MELRTLPQDIIYKIWDKIPLVELERNPKIVENKSYWKLRALNLYGIEKFDTTYISAYQKYVQVASFNEEVSKWSDLHVPREKCTLLAAKYLDFELFEKFWNDVVCCVIPLALLDACTLSFFIKLFNSGYINGTIPYAKTINPEIYDFLFKLPENQFMSVKFDDYITGALMPVNLIELRMMSKERESKYDYSEYDKYVGNLDSVINAAMSTMKFKRVEEISNIFNTTVGASKYYINDNPDIPNIVLPDLNFVETVVMGCANIIKKYGIDINASGLEGAELYVPNIPRSRMKACYEVLKSLPSDDNVNSAKEFWHWILYGKSLIDMTKSGSFEIYADTLENYFIQLGNPKKLANWTKYYKLLPVNMDLIKFPELIDIVVETPMDTSIILPIFMRNFYTPELWLKDYRSINNKIVPTAEIAKRLGLSGPFNFLEPKEYWKKVESNRKIPKK